MLRFADVCRMGVVVTSLSGGRFTVEAEDLQNLRLLDATQQHVVLRGTSMAVRFTFAADVALGRASVAFRVRDAQGGTLDLVQASVQVLRQQQGLRIKATTSVRAAQEAPESVLCMNRPGGSVDVLQVSCEFIEI